MIIGVDTTSLIRSHREQLSPAERRVADVVISDPQLVAFGTVAELAGRAGTSGASVVRLATRIGLVGFTDLQERVQSELTTRIHQAAERIHRAPESDLLGRTATLAADAVQRSLDSISRKDFEAAVDLLARTDHQVYVIASEASRGIGVQFTNELAMIRPRVIQVTGSPVAVQQMLADVVDGDLVVALDLPRYDRWLIEAADFARANGAQVIAVSDSQLSPLGQGAAIVFAVSADGTGPFDSHVSSLALFEALVSGVASHLQGPASHHLDRIEAAWAAGGVLSED